MSSLAGYSANNNFVGHVTALGDTHKPGDRVFEYDYTEQGLTMDRPILVDGRAGKLLSVSADGLGTTSVTFSDDLPPVDLLAAEIRVASPGASSNRLLFSNVSGTAGSPTNTLLFSDPSEYIYDILDAGGGFTVLPFYEDYWGGTWDTVSYNGVSGRTELTGSFGLEMVSLGETVHLGDIVVANLLQPMPLHIEVLDINNPGDDTLEVEGDITAFVTAGDRFRVHQKSPYKYDFSDELKQGPCDWGARYTWSGYRRMPWHWSRAGEDPYHTWNRWYLPSIGRWTSPDAATYPWTNLQALTHCDGTQDGLINAVPPVAGATPNTDFVSYTTAPAIGCPCCVLIYVHGWTTTHDEAKERQKAIDEAYKMAGGVCVTETFKWESGGSWAVPFFSWYWARRQASTVAASQLVNVIAQWQLKCPMTRVNLFTHSLGARVALAMLEKYGNPGNLKTAVLAAAAVDSDSLETGKEFANAGSRIEQLHIAYSREDSVLRHIYEGYSIDSDNGTSMWWRALGRIGMKSPAKVSGNVQQKDFTSEWGSDHGAVFKAALNSGFWSHYSPIINGPCQK